MTKPVPLASRTTGGRDFIPASGKAIYCRERPWDRPGSRRRRCRGRRCPCRAGLARAAGTIRRGPGGRRRAARRSWCRGPRIALPGSAAAMSAPGAAKSRCVGLAGLGKRAAARVDAGDRDDAGIGGGILRRGGGAVVADRGDELDSARAHAAIARSSGAVGRADQADVDHRRVASTPASRARGRSRVAEPAARLPP